MANSNWQGRTWLFFDMGSTLVDDSAAYMGWFQNASQAIGGALSANEIAAGYAAGMARGKATVTGQLKQHGYTGDSSAHMYPSCLDAPYPEAKPVLEQLAKTYKLGIIANQNPGAEQRLIEYGIRDYFQVVIASAEAGVEKPDSQIFQLALAQAGCQPQQAVMIGDRLDNDIFPAKAMGFATVRIWQGYAKHQEVVSPDYEPDVTVENLTQLLDILG